nr:PREDICTED: coiled-coil domain-containing protein 142 [Latimeria chalumnae]XP_014344314.1 PREDICTED: coiled-coil domain-containing protein 142 [Latimeria chalumnae]|eukprot:XP_014344312.1 PREDICTED: coiled-coil domain-containing protein 142 [Latimeria chalumnae]
MSRMSQASGGLLSPLNSLVVQKKISPSGVGSKPEGDGFCEPDMESKSDCMALNGYAASAKVHIRGEKLTGFGEDHKKLKKVTTFPAGVFLEENLSKDKPDGVNVPGSGLQNNFTKSLLKAEAVLRNRINPSLKWLLKQRSESSWSDSDNDDSLTGTEGSTTHASTRLAQVQRCVQGLGNCLSVQKHPKAGIYQGHIKQLSCDSMHKTEFYYHPSYISVGKCYGRLQSLLQHRAQLKLTKDYSKHLKAASHFVRRLSGLLLNEKRTLTKLRHGSDNDSSDCLCIKKLGHLCEELKIHTSHWDKLFEKVRNEHWLRPSLFHIHDSLVHMRRAFTSLALQAVFLMEQYIYCVLCILAYAKLADMSSEMLNDLFRGIEMFNNIIMNFNTEHMCCDLIKPDIEMCQPNLLLHGMKTIFSWNNEKCTFQSFATPRILKVLATERGRLAATKLYYIFVQQDTLLLSVDKSISLSLHWEDVRVPFQNNGCGATKSGIKETKTGLLRPKMGESHQASGHGGLKSAIEEICKKDKEFISLVLGSLASSTDLAWHNFLNKAKPDKPHSAEYKSEHSRGSTSQSEEQIQYEEISALSSREKNAHWQDFSSGEAKRTLFMQYRSMMWKAFGTYFSDLFHFQPWLLTCSNSRICVGLGSLYQCRNQTTALVIQELYEATRKALTPSECEMVAKELHQHVLSQAAFIRWDQVFCCALGSSVKDKCGLDPEKKDATVRTRTGRLLQELFPPLCFLLKCLGSELCQNEGAIPSKWNKPVFPSLRLILLNRWVATAQLSSYWVMTKAHQYLSSWSLSQFLLVTQSDLKLLLAEMERITLLSEAALSKELLNQGIDGTLISQQEAVLASQINEATNSMKVFSEKVLQLFTADCRKMATEIFQQIMPVGKQWRVGFKPELPTGPSDYAATAAQTVIGQVLDGIHSHSEDAQIFPLTEAMTAFMEAWMEHILKQKIKFSLQGALQLKQDFDMIRDLIQSQEYSLSAEIRQALLSLRVFHQVDNAIICLLQQPINKTYVPARTWEPFRNCCCSRNRTGTFNSGSLNSLDSLDLETARNRAILQAETSATSDILSNIRANGNPESYLAANQQEWLALRMYSGRRWKVPSLPCVNRSPEP